MLLALNDQGDFFLSKIIKIFIRDIRTIGSNYAAFLVVLALCILPSLYAWFNIKASWDPYGKESTRGIKIGVVNLDEGATLQDKEIHMGDQIVEALRKNDQLGWQFLSANKAKQLLEEEKIYATVTITKDFSKSLISIVGTDITKGEIIYTVNEKINAIAPKLTDKGVTNLQKMISQTVVETVSNTIFDVANQIGVNLEEQIPKLTNAYNKLREIQGQFGAVNQLVDDSDSGVNRLRKLLANINDQLPNVTTTIANLQQLIVNIQQFVNQSQTAVDQLAPQVMNDFKVAKTVIGEISAGINSLQSAIDANIENIPVFVQSIQAKITSSIELLQSLQGVLKQYNDLADGQPFTPYIQQIGAVIEQLGQMKGVIGQVVEQAAPYEGAIQEKLRQILQAAQSTNQTIDSIAAKLNDELVPQIKNIFAQTLERSKEASQLLNFANSQLPEVKSLLAKANKSIDTGKEGIAYAKKVLPQVEGYVNDFIKKVEEANTEEGLRELIRLLTADVTARSDFLANPVTITEHVIYPMKNYGTGMTPFYTVLCLWVGILLATSMLTAEVEGEYKSYEVYFGKLLTFLLIAIIQGLIVSLGDLFLLRIYCMHPVMFIAVNIFTAIVFTTLVYTLVSVFGNVGKVFGIILLVIQVAGSGGTFPVQLTPRFFQVLNPFMPFTYCISLNREAIGGVVTNVVYRDLLVMACIFIGAIIVAIFLKKPINKLTEGFVRKLKESKLAEQ